MGKTESPLECVYAYQKNEAYYERYLLFYGLSKNNLRENDSIPLPID